MDSGLLGSLVSLFQSRSPWARQQEAGLKSLEDGEYAVCVAYIVGISLRFMLAELDGDWNGMAERD